MQRRAIAINGTVQGVGFRPFVHELASDLGLAGFVKNDSGGVKIEIEGEEPRLNAFLDRLVTQAPPLSQIEDISWQTSPPRGERRFSIKPSRAGESSPIAIAPDAAVCAPCLAEMRDSSNRRFRYPFINCTHCGPRLTIITGSPYDRPRTTMAAFTMCSACRAEYENPADRRFHAQPIACPQCGPALSLRDPRGDPVPATDPIASAAQAIISGKIVAIKGVGGYHLACDAQNPAAVAELRLRKHRYEKPFAVMVVDLASAEALCQVSSCESQLLSGVARPIVLLLKHPHIQLHDQIAPGNPHLGVMLPYTPLHHLLMDALGKRVLVMTSGNRSDEPIAINEPDAIARLGNIADFFLTHDRPIHVRCDDSVTRITAGVQMPLRRSRGYAPQPITLPMTCDRPILAVGGQLKSTFTLASGRRAVLSHHLGDLDDLRAAQAFARDITLYQELFAIQPTVIAHDLHPDYASTTYALRQNLKHIAIQHHHAHMASCMADRALDRRVIGVTFDGSGLGTDGAIWGGEFLIGDYSDFERSAHLRYVPLPGGEQAVRQPWRMAAAHLFDAQIQCDSFEQRHHSRGLHVVRAMLERKFNCPLTSSAGRLFDAVASLIGLRDVVTYEGQAACELEWLAASVKPDGFYPLDFSPDCDTRPLIRAIARDVNSAVDPAIIARRFHSTLVKLIAAVCSQIAQRHSLHTVVLSGGVFMNALLSRETELRLRHEGLDVYSHRRVPANDGGLSLGQAAIAARSTE